MTLFKKGDKVVSKPNNDYGWLIGQIIGIDFLNTPEHDTDN
jgi:hypothetical protein